MYILGINISHDTSSCLLKDGEIVFYQESERFSKIKSHAVNDQGRLDPYENPYLYTEEIKNHTNFIDYIIFSSWDDGDYDRTIIKTILDKLKSEEMSWGKVTFNQQEHHLYHASNSAFSSGFETCACLIIDGSGTKLERNSHEYREIESIYNFNYDGGFEKKFKHYSRTGDGSYFDFKIEDDEGFQKVFSDSIGCGMLFNSFAYFLGYNGGSDAGKIMGLSSYGSNIDDGNNWFFSLNGVNITNNNLVIPLMMMIVNLQPKEQQNILKTLQEQTKKHTIHLIKKALETCNTNNIVLSGGYFLNCVNNYHYLKEFPDVNFYVDPIAHDGGTSIGAAKHLWHQLTKDKTIRKLNTLYL